jgi:NAD+ diphosphatase
MSVEHDDCLLLGRQPRFPAGRYSTLAVCRTGRGLEEAVAREIFEEAGVEVTCASWPASLGLSRPR